MTGRTISTGVKHSRLSQSNETEPKTNRIQSFDWSSIGSAIEHNRTGTFLSVRLSSIIEPNRTQSTRLVRFCSEEKTKWYRNIDRLRAVPFFLIVRREWSEKKKRPRKNLAAKAGAWPLAFARPVFTRSVFFAPPSSRRTIKKKGTARSLKIDRHSLSVELEGFHSLTEF